MSSDFHFTPHPPKSELFAHLLNLIFPGVGLVYWSRDSSGFFWCTLSLGIGVAGICIWILSPFLPQLLASLFILYWLAVEWHVFERVKRTSPDQSTWRRRAVGATPFLGLALLCLSIVLLIAYVSLTRVYSLIHIQNHAMFPHVLFGDVLLVDRRVSGDKALHSGLLVAYDSKAHGVRVARIIASHLNAQTIEINGVEISLDGKPLHLKPIDIDVPHLKDEDRQRLRSSQFFIEYLPQSSIADGWLISRPLNSIRPPMKFSGRLGKNALLVIPDVRYPSETQELMKSVEIIDRTRVLGVPIMIVSSTHPHTYAYSRRGLTLH